MKKNYIAPSTDVQNVKLENMIALSISNDKADGSDALVRDGQYGDWEEEW